MEEQEEKKEPKKRGGYRPNAGRKPKDGVGSVHVGIRINKEHLQLIDENYDGTRTEFITEAIKEKLKRARLI